MRVTISRRFSPRRWTNVGISRGGHVTGNVIGSTLDLLLPGFILSFTREWVRA